MIEMKPEIESSILSPTDVVVSADEDDDDSDFVIESGTNDLVS